MLQNNGNAHMSHVEHPATQVPSPTGLRILYADDMKELREVAKVALTREGHQIECVPGGKEALDRLTADPAAIDLLITDHHMPGMDGIELVQAVRERKLSCRILVFCSALSRDVQEAYRRCAVDRFLYKPVLPSDLRRVIREIFPAGSNLPKDRDASS
jgi:CheY-like chemotaxis protein